MIVARAARIAFVNVTPKFFNSHFAPRWVNFTA